MGRATRTIVSLGLSLAMAFGGVSSTALAEAIQEVGIEQEGAIPSGESPEGGDPIVATEEDSVSWGASEVGGAEKADGSAAIGVAGEGDDVIAYCDEEAPAESTSVADEEEPVALAAQASVEHSGKWGGCTWKLYSDGLLRVSPTNGKSGRLANSRGYEGVIEGEGEYSFPWFDYRYSIKKVVFDKGVSLPKDSSGMFLDCQYLKSLDVSGWDTSAVLNMSYMFDGCRSLTSLDLSSWDTSNVTNMAGMFTSCGVLSSLDVSTWDTSAVTDMSGMFCFSGISSLDVSSWDTSSVKDTSRMFFFSSISSIEPSNWNTSSVTNMYQMFSYCESLSDISLSGWDTTGVKNMSEMFAQCSSITSIDISGWDISGVSDMGGMFSGCDKLASLDVSGWDTSNVVRMGGMFSGCDKLASLDVSGWDTSNVVDMSSMFFGCAKLSKLDVSGWDTSSVTNMYRMFYGCSKLVSLDLSGWVTSKVENGLADGSTWFIVDDSEMFAGCSSLTWLKVGKRYVIKDAGMFPDSNASNGKWWSTARKAWVSKDAIVSGRSGVADTYRTAGGKEKANPMTAKATKASVSVTYSPRAATVTPKNVGTTGKVGTLSYANASDDTTAKGFVVDKSTGEVTLPKATRAGTYDVKVRVTAAGSPNYRSGSKTVSYKVVVNKAANPMTLTPATRTASYSTLRTKSVTVTKPLTVSGSIGTKTYARAQNSNYFTVDKATGRVTIKKGTPKGTYTLKVKVTAAGGPNYEAGSKTVTGKITVK